MSYFPYDIPFMSDNELKENGIRTNLTDNNVGDMGYIKKRDAIDMCGGYIELAYAMSGIKNADVAPVERSRWIRDGDGAMCEKCGREAVYQVVDMHWEYENFCPHCGARMEKGKT